DGLGRDPLAVDEHVEAAGPALGAPVGEDEAHRLVGPYLQVVAEPAAPRLADLAALEAPLLSGFASIAVTALAGGIVHVHRVDGRVRESLAPPVGGVARRPVRVPLG